VIGQPAEPGAARPSAAAAPTTGAAPGGPEQPALLQRLGSLPIPLRHPLLLAALGVAFASVWPYRSTSSVFFLNEDFALGHSFAGRPAWYWLTLFARPWLDASVFGVPVLELRPLVALSYQLDAWLGAGQPALSHAMTIAAHLLCGLLVLAIAHWAGRLSEPAAAISAMLFAVFPSQATVAAWTAGRIESITALCALAAFLAFALWRQRGGRWRSGLALGLFLLALLNDVSAVFLLATFVAYDLLLSRALQRRFRATLLQYAPFAALVLLSLAVHWAALGQPPFNLAALAQSLSLATVAKFGSLQFVSLYMLVTGRMWWVAFLPGWLRWPAHRLPLLELLILVIAAFAAIRSRMAPGVPGIGPRLVFFGLAWWLAAIAPLLAVSESPRRVYLASVGLAIAVGVLVDALRRSRSCYINQGGIISGGWLVVLTAMLLPAVLQPWILTGLRSQGMLRTLHEQVRRVPDGSLVVVEASGISPFNTDLWVRALPFALQPPFTDTDLAQRVFLVATPDVWCCPRDEWAAQTRQTIRAWAQRPDQPPVEVMTWLPAGRPPQVLSSASDPTLRARALAVAEAATPEEMADRLAQLAGLPGRRLFPPVGPQW